MASNSPLSDMLTQASFHFSNARPLLPMYAHLIVSALFPIYTGAHASLSRPSSAAKLEKPSKKAADDEDDDEDEEKIQKMEGMSNKDAIILPVTAALVLAGLYFLIMRYGADIINLVLGWYFAGIGVYSVGKLINDGTNIGVSLLFPTYYRSKGSLWRVAGNERMSVRQAGDQTETSNSPVPVGGFFIPKSIKNAIWSTRRQLKQKYTVKAYIESILDLCANLTIINAVSAFAGIATIVYVNTVSKPWFLTNLQGFAVSYSALQLMSPTTFATGSLILGALFCYDIWAVFFTPLMVTVAKNLDQPIKLVFPRPDEPSQTPGEPPIRSYSMLGLGDIVLPGIMIGLALRFDLYMFYLKKQRKVQSTVDSSGQTAIEGMVQKAPYVPTTGHWGDRLWTIGLPKDSIPAQLRSSFPKPYFTASIIGYVVGMLTTLGVMSVFQHAQPALLYLVPGVVGSLWSTALARREVKAMWDFSEAVTGDQFADGEADGTEAAAKAEGKLKKIATKGVFEQLWQEIWSGSQNNTDPKSDERQADASSKTTSKGENKAGDDRSKQDAERDGLLFAFSVARYAPKTTTGEEASRPDAESNSKGGPSGSSFDSESSEDAVVVNSDDLVDGKEIEATPRYRTRSTKAVDE